MDPFLLRRFESQSKVMEAKGLKNVAVAILAAYVKEELGELHLRSISANQRISVSAYQRISVSAYQRISVSAYQRTKQEPLAERLGIGQQKMSLVENTEVLEVPKIVAIVLATRYKRLIVIQTKKFRVLLKPEFLITPFSID